MRLMLAVAAGLFAVSTLSPAAAQEYPWCANMNLRGNVENCGFVTYEQCRLTVSGNGGFCAVNPFYAAAHPEAMRKQTRTKSKQTSR